MTTPELHFPDPTDVEIHAMLEWVRVVHAETGERIPDVVAASVSGGWYETDVWPDNGGDAFVRQRHEAPIRLELTEDAPDTAIEWFKIPLGSPLRPVSQ